MSSILARKQEELNQKKVKDLLRLPENKKCFDCPTKGPAYVNTTIQTFVCARCSGLVREAGHRVKSVSASKFSGPEALALMMGGNGVAQRIWLSNYSTPNSPEPESDDDVRAFMRQKYYENKWLDRNLIVSHNQQVRNLIAQSFTEDGQPIKPNFKLAAMATDSRQQQHMHVVPTASSSQPMQLLPKIPVSPTAISFDRKRASIDSQRSSISSMSEHYPASVYSSQEHSKEDYLSDTNSHRQSMDSARFSSYQGSVDGDDKRDSWVAHTEKLYENSSVMHTSPIQNVSKLPNMVNNIQKIPHVDSAHSPVTPAVSKSRPVSNSGTFDSFISELSGLKLEKTVKRATYTGGILSPSSSAATPLTPTPAPTTFEKDKNNLFDADFFSKFNPAKTNEGADNDQYAALRGISSPVVSAPVVKEEEKQSSSSEDDDEEDWQEFCSSSNFEENVNTEVPVAEKAEVIKPAVTVDLFSDLDPRSMFKQI